MKEKEFLEELKNHWIKNDVPNISFTNAKFLRDLIKIKKAKKKTTTLKIKSCLTTKYKSNKNMN